MDASTVVSSQEPWIDHLSYPHIVEAILDQSSWTTLARWRQTSKKYCDHETSIVFSKAKDIRCPIRRIPPARIGHPLGFAGVLVHSVTSVLWRGGTLSIVGLDDIPAPALFGAPFVHLDAPFVKPDKRILISRFVLDILKVWPDRINAFWPQAYPGQDLAWTPDRFETAFNNIKLYTHEQYATSAGPDHHLAQHPPMFHRVSLDTRTGCWTDDMELPEELEEYQDSDTEYTLDDDP